MPVLQVDTIDDRFVHCSNNSFMEDLLVTWIVLFGIWLG